MATDGWLRRMCVEAVRCVGPADITEICRYIKRQWGHDATYNRVKSPILRAVRAGDIKRRATMRGKQHRVLYYVETSHLKGWGFR